MKVVIYSRVSTISQDYIRQTNELKEFAEKMNWNVVEIFEEKISGMKKNEDRKGLSDLIKFVRENNIDKVITWEISRIGRNSLEVLKSLEILNENKISLFIKNYNLETLDDLGKINPLTQFLVQILASVSMMEKATTRQRMASGYAHFRANGGKVGRKEGYKKDEKIFLEENKEVVKLLRQGYSVRKTMKLADRSSGLVQKVKKMMAL
jgi:DNA invertase Pin-like site-specific DNA recombinase